MLISIVDGVDVTSIGQSNAACNKALQHQQFILLLPSI